MSEPIADALAGHWFRVFNPWFDEREVGCECGWRQPLNADRNQERHNRHLAAVIQAALTTDSGRDGTAT